MWQLKNLSACSFECTLRIVSELKFLWQTEQIKFSFLFGIMHFFWCILNWSVLVKFWLQYSQWRTLSVMCTLVWRLKFSLCLKILWHVRGTFKNDIWIRMHSLLMIQKLSSICKFIFTCWTFMNVTLICVDPKMLIEIWFVFYRFATGFTGKHLSLITNQNCLTKVNLGMCDMTPDLTPSLVLVHRSGDPTLRNDVLPPILVMMALFG